MILFTISFIIIGFLFIIVGIKYDKKSHNDFYNKGYASGVGSDFIDILVVFILGFLPWYVMKTIMILISLSCFVLIVLANS